MLNFRNINIASIALLALIILLNILFQVSFWFLLLPFFGWISMTVIGSFNIEWNYFLKATHNNHNTSKNEIALTFDDGPHPEFTPKVLEILKQFNAKATFFVIGKNAEKHPELVQQIIAEGHDIGNHSYLHSNNYGFLSRNEVTKDIMKSQKILFEITGKRVQLFRPPFGVTSPNIARAVKNLSLKTFGWSVRSYDTVAKSSEMVFLKISSKIKKGDVLLLHDTSTLSVEVLEKLLQYLKTKDVNSVTLSNLFKTDFNEK